MRMDQAAGRGNGVLHPRDFSNDKTDRGGGPDLLGTGGVRG
jgi:hypothetical protein